ncbi:hypothetical protein V8Q34_14680 [Blautia sp. JLR.GB0024]|uniref:hypothetical protein n=1 Tax=Blautia sp. JLR.GB0024 TaxID=3123295 RepID=UPI0030046F2C
MNDILGSITRQDIYNIAVPVLICVIGWLLPLIRNNEPRFVKRWMCKKEKSNRERYGYFFFGVIVIGMIFHVIGILIVFSVNLILGQFSILIPTEYVKVILSVICGICILVFMLSVQMDTKKIEFQMLNKFAKPVVIFLYYTPFVCSIWLWCLASHISSPVLNIIIYVVIITCEIMQFIVFDDNKTYKYLWMKMHFNDGSEKVFQVECVKQRGNWIVAEDLIHSSEVRYRREDLVKVEYFNIGDGGSDAKSS